MTGSPISIPEFRNFKLRHAYEQLGFAQMKLLEQDEAEMLKSEFKTMFPFPAKGFFSTALASPVVRREAHQRIASVLTLGLESTLRNFRTVLCSFVGRAPGSGEDDLPMHQDWSFVNESAARSMSVWIPLQDVSSENGCLQIVPHSHLHRQPARAVGSGFRYRSIEKELRANNLLDMPLKTGEAVFFDHRLIHASTSNRSTDYRLAIGAVLLPVSAPLRLGLRGPDGKIAFSDYEDNFILDADLQTFAMRQEQPSPLS